MPIVDSKGTTPWDDRNAAAAVRYNYSDHREKVDSVVTIQVLTVIDDHCWSMRGLVNAWPGESVGRVNLWPDESVVWSIRNFKIYFSRREHGYLHCTFLNPNIQLCKVLDNHQCINHLDYC